MPENENINWDELLGDFKETAEPSPLPLERHSNVIISREEKDDADREKRRRAKLTNDEKESIISLRKILSIIVTVGVFVWMIFIGFVIFCVACRFFGAILSDAVLLALVGGSTANILGMLTIILIFLFPPKNNVWSNGKNNF